MTTYMVPPNPSHAILRLTLDIDPTKIARLLTTLSSPPSSAWSVVALLFIHCIRGQLMRPRFPLTHSILSGPDCSLKTGTRWTSSYRSHMISQFYKPCGPLLESAHTHSPSLRTSVRTLHRCRTTRVTSGLAMRLLSHLTPSNLDFRSMREIVWLINHLSKCCESYHGPDRVQKSLPSVPLLPVHSGRPRLNGNLLTADPARPGEYSRRIKVSVSASVEFLLPVTLE